MLPALNNPDRATHLLHPYPAKLLVHIPNFFLSCKSLSRPKDKVLDPFCGSGTVLLEAQLSGRVPIGADVNPLARLIATVKTTPIEPRQLRESLARVLGRAKNDRRSQSLVSPDIPNLDYWFHPHVVRDLCRLRDSIDAISNPVTRDFFRVCLSVTARKTSLADPRLAVPVRLKPTKYPLGHPERKKLTRHLRSLQTVDSHAVFSAVCEANIARMAALWATPHGLSSYIEYDQAQVLVNGQPMKSSSIQLAITSPPYPGAQKYIRSSMFGLGWLGLCGSDTLIDYKRATIGREEVLKSDSFIIAGSGVPSASALLEQLNQQDPVRAARAYAPTDGRMPAEL